MARDDAKVHALRVVDQRIRVSSPTTPPPRVVVPEEPPRARGTHPGEPRRVDAQVFVQSFDPRSSSPIEGPEAAPGLPLDPRRDLLLRRDVLGDVPGGCSTEERGALAGDPRALKEFVAGAAGSRSSRASTETHGVLDTRSRRCSGPPRSTDRGIETAGTRPFRVAPTEEGRVTRSSPLPDATAEGVDRLWRERDGWDWYWMYHAPGRSQARGVRPRARARRLGARVPRRAESPSRSSSRCPTQRPRLLLAVDQIYRTEGARRRLLRRVLGRDDPLARDLPLLSGNRRFRSSRTSRSTTSRDRRRHRGRARRRHRPIAGDSLTGVQVEDPDGHALLEPPRTSRAPTARRGGLPHAGAPPPLRHVPRLGDPRTAARAPGREDVRGALRDEGGPGHPPRPRDARGDLKRKGGTGPHPPGTSRASPLLCPSAPPNASSNARRSPLDNALCCWPRSRSSPPSGSSERWQLI